MFCPYCGFEIADGFRFCPKCGKAMPDIGGKSPTADPCPIGRYAQSRNTDQNADGWNRAHAKQSCKTRAHQPQWRKRFIVDCETSNKKCLMLVVLGVIVCMVGWSIIDASTVYASFQIRDSEYLRQYGQNGPSFLQWLAFLVGLMLDIGGIAYVYIAWSRLMSRVRPIWNLPPIIAKPIAIAMCVIVYVALIAILTLLKGTARPSVWDYLIFVAMCKAIWRFFVGEKAQKQMTEEEGAKEVKAKRNLMIRLLLYVGIGVLAIYVCTPLRCSSLHTEKMSQDGEAGQGRTDMTSKRISMPTTRRITAPKLPSCGSIGKENLALLSDEELDMRIVALEKEQIATPWPEKSVSSGRVSLEWLKDPKNQKSFSAALAKVQREEKESVLHSRTPSVWLEDAGVQKQISASISQTKQNQEMSILPVRRKENQDDDASNRKLLIHDLEGAVLVAEDGTYLGKITWNDVDPDSIFNNVGRFGSDVSATSIWNDVSRYGSDISADSPFNDMALSPPRIVKDGNVVGVLSVNDGRPDVIHPKALLEIVGNDCDEEYKKKLMSL